MTSRVLGSAIVAAVLVAACDRRPVRLPSADVLAGDVTIRRDTFGIPHILATSEEAAAFGFGYAQAEDHAVEIGRRYIRARGTEAAVFGESGLENDVEMAQFDNLTESRRGLERLSPLFQRIVAAYAAGVNRYVEKHRDALPEWMPEITAADVIANSRASAAGALAGPALPRQLRAKYDGVRTQSAEPSLSPTPTQDDEPGSNAFALAGSRTASGKPILLGNPHLAWASLYWEAHVRVPGRIDFYGSTLVGIPVLRAGFNDRLGFVTTNNAPDLDDLFALQLDPSRSDHYLFDGRSLPLVRRDVTIAVRSMDGSMRQERRTFWSSHVGPLVHRTAERAFAVRSTRLDAFRYFEGFYVASKARSLRDWLGAMRQNLVPTSNFTYADADGNILYLWNGRVPLRRDPQADYRLDVAASSTADVWSSVHPLADLPRMLNPRGGYIQNANNPPEFVSLRDRIDMSRYPGYFERGALALRPQLALEMLDRTSKVSLDDVIKLKYDTRLLLADRVVPALVGAVRESSAATADARAGAEVLEAWDRRAFAGSRGAVLFQAWWDGYAAKVRQPFETPWQREAPFRTPSGLADPVQAIAQLDAAVRATRAAHGRADVAWGAVHRFRAGTLDLPGEGASGSYGAFRVMRFDEVAGQPVRVAGNLERGRPLAGFGDAWVLAVDFSAPVTGWSVLAYGQTADLESPHSRDQLAIFAAHRLRRAWFTEQEIRAHVEREYRPQ